MRVIVCEMKKIWNIKILGIVAAICVIYFFLFMYTWVANYPRGTWFNTIDFAHHLTEMYGPTLEQDDFEDFLRYRDSIIADLDTAIAANAVFAAAGINNWQDYEDALYDFTAQYSYLSQEEIRAHFALRDEFFVIDGRLILGNVVNFARMTIPTHHKLGMAYSRMRSFDLIVAVYNTNVIRDDGMTSIDAVMQPAFLVDDGTMIPPRWNAAQIRRLEAIRDSGELTSIIAQDTIIHTTEYGMRLAILVVLATLILVAPLIVTDQAGKVHWLQYSSKAGRGVFKKQFIAVMLSAVGITTILVVVFAGVFSVNGTWAFWNNGINSFMSWRYHWLSITYGQFSLLIVGIMYLLSLGAAAFAFVFSRFSRHMIRLIFKLIPFFISALLLAYWVLGHFLCVFNVGDMVAQMLMLMVSLILGILIAIAVIFTEQRVELR